MRYYSQSTGSTYLSGVHGKNMPADARPISEERYQAVIANPTPGTVRSHDADGLPILVDAPLPSDDENGYLLRLRQEKTGLINQQCREAITGGFWSDALGSRHHYSSQLDDQLNLTGAILRGADLPYACRDGQGVKSYRLHSAEQLHRVGDDFTRIKLEFLQRAEALKQRIAEADPDALLSIDWETPL